MYGLLIEESIQSTELLETQISEILKDEKLIEDEVAKSYDSLTTEYFKYLRKTYTELIGNIEDPTNYNGEFSEKEPINEFFFNGEKYNLNGAEFISKLENYRTDILELIIDENLAKRVRKELNTDVVQNRDGKKFDYLNYMYQDLPLISVLAHMKNREKLIVELENDFLKNRLLHE
ncbi:hypothetical protein [Mangrovimonas sp. YM274]|uniref:hypothetical protein n=1 Tax=Mangrovimonas sp. YM274 TaxID=3070660 RepID=UPI0027DAEF6B|nr:hypothetical protein [Mangrovimonas sp. YM274]WMI70097.1 hypothetical protein RBH95_07040 [Mangrovimonas sp. YM274]